MHHLLNSERGRDRGRGSDFGGGHGSFRDGRGSYGGRQTVGDKGPRQCKHCEEITSLKVLGEI